jgi:phosphoribosylglycinamide formyltransferase-1
VADALAWGVKVTGATVHLAYEDVDGGPIVLQEAVAVLPGDDESSLHERIKAVERRLFPEAVRLALSGRIIVRGRTVDVVDIRGPLEVSAEP